ncbi:bifunctional UDP-N-acetylglucosamine diphosphorylase/glucosamine-1-phosphate N-acetyltransferase GlmU [Peptostreptococcus equinus]|uniref:Bifunctional protein GlmU n=1 Tax=Peptostreptococcus equinus TaxID=3003601 RepID=A0ABY7JNU6_9FIRM|nr:bifunctional UDP-N-acetylglucosamine diphosphorylase/glucosamine-1-phosphate N-acetyltransferase GlmU [Peptostreptococcus sp. CBA3647]WAW15039.1 bifunctional UDP-N-acetylglucosamine diphosphorylase/glucosamine-1-phosphate N-acetyltransferase GlmU [Peptostreptococcus sp. CBA3647]
MKKAIVLAAGKGTRMKSSSPKVVHKVCGKEMVNHVIDSSKKAGVDQIIAILGHGIDQVKSVLGEDVKTVYQEEQLGTAHAVMMADKYINDEDTVVVLCGDTPLIMPETMNKFFEYHDNGNYGVTVLTARVEDPTGYGRIVRDENGSLVKIVEQKDADENTLKIDEINSGIYCFNGAYLKSSLQYVGNDNAQGEYYLPDTIEIIKSQGMDTGAFLGATIDELMGVNSRNQLSVAEKTMKLRINEMHMTNGVTIIDTDSTYIDADVEIGNDTIILPGCMLTKGTKIGTNCKIGPYTCIENSVVGDGTSVKKSELIDAKVGMDTNVGPYAYLRPKSDIGDNCKIGDFVEVKNTQFGDGSKASHLSYIGDAEVGKNVNIGCGVVFVNYDGKNKFKSIVKDNAFVGSNANLVAPVTIEEDAFIATGSTITDDIPVGALAVARQRQVVKEGWVAKKREKDNKK